MFLSKHHKVYILWVKTASRNSASTEVLRELIAAQRGTMGSNPPCGFLFLGQFRQG